jgi:hypothetical protein
MSNSIGIGFSPSATGKSGWSTGGLGDLAAFIPGLGRSLYVNNNPINGPLLGGGLKGRMPQPIIVHDNSNTFARTRFTLKDAWNTSSTSGSSYNKRIITPFRAVYNAGDLLSRQEYSCGGSCQTPQSIANVKGLKTKFGSISTSCKPSVLYSINQVNTAVPPSSCNVKFVYDGSDYTTYLKFKAINKNYNDLAFGGNDYNSSQSVIKAIRRY